MGLISLRDVNCLNGDLCDWDDLVKPTL